MTRLLVVLLALGAQLTLTSCANPGVALSPLTEQERQELRTIGIAAEVSRLETMYSRDSSMIDDGLRAIQDRLNDAGQGAINGVKFALPGLGTIKCSSGGSTGTSCLGSVLVALAVVPAAGVIGGVVGAIDRKTYSNPPLMELPERAVIQAVQESIDAVGLPERLRDQVWEKVRGYQTYHFELVPGLPSDIQELQGESTKDKGARYWSLRDKGIQTLLKVRIPLIEFRGSEPEDSFRLFVHVETTLLRTDDQVCIRHRTWKFEGESHRLDEWRDNDAKLLIDELDRGLPLIAQRVSQAFFEPPSLFSFGASRAVIPTSESLACRG